MGLLQYGQALGFGAKNFLDTYMSLAENDRANKALEIRDEMLRQEQEERQRQEALRQLQMQQLIQQMELAAAAEQRKAADVARENAARTALSTPVPNVSSSRGMLTGELKPGQNPWVRPTGEEALNAILPYLDPEKAATILSQQGNIDNRLAMQMMIANQNNEARRDIATQGNETRKDIATSNNAMREALARLKGGNININMPTQSQVDTLARGIIDKTVDPNGISKRGGLQAAVWSRVKELSPEFDIIKAGAGAAFEKNPGAMSTKALLNSIDPLLENLVSSRKEVADTGSPLLNAPLHWAQKNVLPEKMGGVAVTAFDNLRNDVIAEVERGLLNTGVLSDFKYQLALSNLKSAQTQKQTEAAVKNIKTVIRARLEALEAGPYKDRTDKKPGLNFDQNAIAEELKRRKGR